MAVRLRLQRKGKKKFPFYRIVAIDQRSKRDGEPIEILGRYDPIAKCNNITVNTERVNYWLGVGALPSETVSVLIRKNSTVQVSETR
ncbi:MAG: 30S ribosomal protein S16 [Elusimicrobiota bacterium]|nr:30S ribosomal protein S16 [Elusimicrobiota bacterium]